MSVVLSDPVGDVTAADELKKMTHEFKFLLDQEGIDIKVQAKLAVMGVLEVDVFAKLEDTQAGMRAVIKDEIGLVPSAAPGNRGMLAKVLSLWDITVQRGKKRKAEDAELKVGDVPRRLSKMSHLALLRSYNEIHEELAEDEVPGPRWLEIRLDQMENGEIVPEKLSEVITWEEEAPGEGFGLQFRPDGTLRSARTSTAKGIMPSNPEELRQKYELSLRHWEFLRLRLPDHQLLSGYKMEIWESHVKWLLGKRVYKKEVRSDKNEFVYRPSWELLLGFEYEVRKKACWAINVKAKTLAEALLLARDHQSTYVDHFSTPFSMAAGEASAKANAEKAARGTFQLPPAPPRPLEGLQRPQITGAQQGKGQGTKSKGKGKAAPNSEQLAKQICWNYNKARGCELGNKCPRRHVVKGSGKGE